MSIRKKITYSFYFLLLVILATVLLTYGIVWQVEKKVEQVGIIDDFFNTTLELRRFEKNYFLYEQEKDYDENLLYARRLKSIFEENKQELRSLSSKAKMARAQTILREYNDYMALLHPLTDPQAEANTDREQWHILQDKIRTRGKGLTDFAEQTAQTQKQMIHSLLRTTRLVLEISICTLVLLSIAMATFLARRVVQSLKLLEGYTKKIAQGQLLKVPMKGAEKEIKSILQAFNRMTHELQIHQKQLVQSEKLAALGTLLAGVAHELNNPLSNISTSAQILSEEMEGSDLEFNKNLVAQIEEQSDKARDIVKTLLEFSRNKEFEKKKIRLHQLILETIRLIRGQIASQVAIQVEIPDELTITADKQRMQQVFLNLIKNAVDALHETGHIWISARNLTPGEFEGSNEVEIMIEDDGPGIPPEHIPHIFDPFFTTKDVGKGSGLGLFVVHDIIEAHGGTISVDSHPGKGTTFIIWLTN